jgi:hypothetical protein
MTTPSKRSRADAATPAEQSRAERARGFDDESFLTCSIFFFFMDCGFFGKLVSKIHKFLKERFLPDLVLNSRSRL